jgi:hypothetical protein
VLVELLLHIVTEQHGLLQPRNGVFELLIRLCRQPRAGLRARREY